MKNKHNNYSKQVKNLFDEQKKNWNLLSSNYLALNDVRIKIFDYDGFIMKLQFNPKRIISSSAKVDKKSIAKRKCFLCKENRPLVQNGIEVENDFVILINPYPIFPEHLTIVHKKHIEQKIFGNFEVMLSLSEILPNFTVFYNGPRCGASAPDHLHFQAGNRNFMLIDYQYYDIKNKYGNIIIDNSEIQIFAVDDGIRKMIILESYNKNKLIEEFNKLYKIMNMKSSKSEEPMMNIISLKDADKLRVIIFPRAEHRPRQYYEKGKKNILLSPASVDFGGTVIIPQKKDFYKITKKDITDIFQQVSISKNNFSNLF